MIVSRSPVLVITNEVKKVNANFPAVVFFVEMPQRHKTQNQALFLTLLWVQDPAVMRKTKLPIDCSSDTETL